MRIFFDTNVLFSAFGFPGLCRNLFRECIIQHTIVLSDYVLDELSLTLSKKLDFTSTEINSIIGQLREHCEVIARYPKVDILVRDLSDVPILSAAIAARVDLIVSGDRDLLDLSNSPIVVLSPRQLHDRFA